MKRFFLIWLLIGLFLAMTCLAWGKCVTLQDRVLTYSPGHYLAGKPIPLGFDIYGYNYQAHLFKGSYANVYLGKDGFPPYKGDDAAYLAKYPAAATKWYWPYRKDQLEMKWNDAWLSNKDCNGDGLLDRNYGHASYIGSGAWETNHQWGSYLGADGKTYNWDYFCKIVAVPSDANLVAGNWYTADGKLIGYTIWGAFAVIMEVYNDQGTGDHGILYKAARPGFGGWEDD